VFAALGVSASASDIPEQLVPIAAGKVAGQTWELGMARGQPRTRCFKLEMSGAGVLSCEPTNGLSEEDWSRVTGTTFKSASAELEITSRRAARLKLFLGHPGPLPGESGPEARPGTWRRVVPKLLTVRQARETHLAPNFRFAVVADRGNLCVEKVRAFDQKGRLLEKLSVPCEY
jgi:hypothetical protein